MCTNYISYDGLASYFIGSKTHKELVLSRVLLVIFLILIIIIVDLHYDTFLLTVSKEQM